MPADRKLLDILTETFRKYDRPENKMNYQRWFKEELKNPVSFKGAVIKKVAQEVYKQLGDLPKGDLFDTWTPVNRYMNQTVPENQV